jgi:peptide-methionine (S)-S-oxide reductase
MPGRVRPQEGARARARSTHWAVAASLRAAALHAALPQVSYETLCDVLFQSIDPTLRDQVGMDYGTQYRHGVYAQTEQQLAQAQKIVAALQAKLPQGKRIVTEVAPAKVFWPAEEYHQQYLAKGGRFGSPQSPGKGCTDPVRCYG